MQPNFIIVGAPRSGTTSLYSYCKQHPEICMSSIKETNYFSVNDKRLNWRDYLGLFDGAESAKAIGEASPSYLRFENSSNLIRTHLPNCKIVILLRNPIDRFISDYYYSRSMGWNLISLDALLSLKVDIRSVPDNFSYSSLLEKGFYSKQVDRYLSVFDRSKVFIRLYDVFASSTLSVMDDLFAFLGVSSFEPDTTKAYNKRARSETLQGSGFPSLRRVAALCECVIAELEYRVLHEKACKPGSKKTRPRDRLFRIYEEDIGFLEKIIDEDLSHWSPETAQG